jgi:Type IX secretion system membrane protein PorP/SprF
MWQKMGVVFHLFCWLGLGRSLTAQQTPMYSSFRENWVLINPAFWDCSYLDNADNESMLNLTYRSESEEVNDRNFRGGVFFTKMCVTTIDSKIKNYRPTFQYGGGYIHDQFGNNINNKLYINFAKILTMNNGSMNITIGGNVGYQSYTWRLDPNQFHDWASDVYAQSLNGRVQKSIMADIGLLYTNSHGDNNQNVFYLGASYGNTRIRRPHRLGYGDFPYQKTSPILNGLGGYSWSLNDNKSALEASLWWRCFFKTSADLAQDSTRRVSLDGVLRYKHSPRCWLFGGMGSALDLHAGFGYQVGGDNFPRFDVGGAISLQPKHRLKNRSYEFFFKFILDKHGGKSNK